MTNDEATGADETTEEFAPDYYDWVENQEQADEARDAYFRNTVRS